MKQVNSSTTALSIILFRTEWSAACQLMEMICRDVEKSYRGVINFYSVDAEREAAIANDYGIIETPTLLVLQDSRVVYHIVGLTAKNKLIETIEIAVANLPNK